MRFLPRPPLRRSRRAPARALRRLAGVGVAAAVLASAGACTTEQIATVGCFGSGRKIVDIPSGKVPFPGNPAQGDRATLDARGGLFVHGEGQRYHVKIHRDRTGNQLCLVGGTYTTTFASEDTPWSTWHDLYAVHVAEEGFQLVGARFFNVGDMVSLRADDWRLTAIAAEPLGNAPGAYVHDDCVENDTMFSGIVEDSKFDGCFNFMSSADPLGNGADETVEVRSTLVRLQPYRNSYNIPKYGENRHGGFFKWNDVPAGGGVGTPPRLYVHDSTFRADTQAAYGGSSSGFLALPPGSRCHDVTLVAKGGWGSDPARPAHPGWKQRDIDSWTSQCTNLRFADERTWDQRVAAWDAAHPA